MDNKKSKSKKGGETVKDVYKRLYQAFGARRWWPAETQFEVIIGAILTQNTNWKNVEKAIEKLKDKDLLNPARLYKIRNEELAELIRSSGYYNIKTKRIKNFIAFLQEEYRADLDRMFQEEMMVLRDKLLTIKGIGPETADSILLYAGEKPTFVVDAYTKRIFSRHGWISDNDNYEEIRNFFMENLNHDVQLFNEYHALLVYLGKEFCKKEPRCQECPLITFLR